MIDGHLDVGGEDCDQYRDEAPGCWFSGLLKEEAQAAGDLGCAAELDQQCRVRQVLRHDAGVGGCRDKVQDAGQREGCGGDFVAFVHASQYKGNGQFAHGPGWRCFARCWMLRIFQGQLYYEKMAVVVSPPPDCRCVLVIWTQERHDGFLRNHAT